MELVKGNITPQSLRTFSKLIPAAKRLPRKQFPARKRAALLAQRQKWVNLVAIDPPLWKQLFLSVVEKHFPALRLFKDYEFQFRWLPVCCSLRDQPVPG
jgi:hypothetical protein